MTVCWVLKALLTFSLILWYFMHTYGMFGKQALIRLYNVMTVR